MRTHTLCALAATAAVLALAACGGSSGGTATGTGDGGGTQMETAYDKAVKAVKAAPDADAVDAAVKAAEVNLSAPEIRNLDAVATARKTALAKMARAKMQKDALDAVGMVDTEGLSDATKLAAAKTKIAALQAALTAAVDVSDADRATYQTQLNAANLAVNRQEHMNRVKAASMTLATALTALSDAGSTPTAAQVTDAESALDALEAAIEAGDEHLTAEQKATYNSEVNQAPARIDSAKKLLAAEDLRKENERVAGIVKAITDTQIAAAMTAVGMVMDDSEDETVMAAQNAINAAKMAIANANIPDGSKQMLLTALALHEGVLDRANASRLAAIERHNQEVEDTRVAGIVKDITDTQIAAAMTAVGMVTDTSDGSDVTDAQKKIDEAKAAIEGAKIPETEKAKLRTALKLHQGNLDEAKDSRMKAMTIKRIRDGQITPAMSAVGMVKRDSSRESVADAEAKLAAAETAINDANISADQKAELRAALAQHQTTFNTAIAGRKTFAEAMFKSLEGPADDGSKNALNNLQDDAAYEEELSGTGKPSGLTIDMAQGAGTLLDSDYESPVVFTKEAVVKTVDEWQVAALAEWKVSDLTESRDDEGDQRDGLDKFHDRVRVWNNRSPFTPLAADFFEDDPDKPANAGTHTEDGRLLSLGTGIDKGIESPEFETAGHKDWKPADPSTKEVRVRGTYYGAPGVYRCTYSTAASCRVSTGKGGKNLTAAWEFVYDEGARVNIPGRNYVYFGWWVRENVSDGMPRMATVFIGKGGEGVELPTTGASLSGTATFEGPAAGVYAIHDPLRGKGEAGEFEAVARLEALFGDRSASNNPVPLAGMTGTVKRFRLNGGSGDPGWTLTLERNAWADDAKIDDRADSTVWEINGVKGAKVGIWGGRMYDTTVGESIGGADGDGQPDVVIGTFYSEHGTTHRMAGAFGAKNITKNYGND